MDLYSIITEDMKAAMRAGNSFELSVLRLLLAGIKNIEIDKHGETITESEIVTLVAKQIKQRKEAAELYIKGDRRELADKEEKEIVILNKYLPQQMTTDELKNSVEKTIAELPDDQKGDFGKVMKAVIEKVKGQADGKTVAMLVREKIG